MKILTAILLVLVSSVVYGLEKEGQPGQLFVDTAAFTSFTSITLGPIEMNIETGEVKIEDGMSLSGAAAAFWEAVETHFKEKARLRRRINLLLELMDNSFHCK